MSAEKMDAIVSKLARQKDVLGVSFSVASPSREYASTHLFGNLSEGNPYYIASINKMILTALAIRHFKNVEALRGIKVSRYFPGGYLTEFLYKGNAQALQDLSLYHLLTHTSGVPCYLLDKERGREPLMRQLLSGYDEAWPLERVLSSVGRLNAKFYPGTSGKAYYSNTNFRLAARVLELETGKSIRTVLTDFFTAFGMRHTLVVSEDNAAGLVPIHVGRVSLMPSAYLASTGYDIYSTAEDQIIFAQHFFSGRFFPQVELKELFKWNRIFFPLKYGMGLQRFDVPRVLSPFRAFPPMVGHSGSTGAFCFYVAEKDLYITGAVNQAKKVPAGFRAMVKMVNNIL